MPHPWQAQLADLIGPQQGRRKAIAEKAGIGPSYLTKLLSRDDANPTLETLQRLAVAVGATLAFEFVLPGAHRAGGPAPAPPPVEAPIVPPRIDLSAAVRQALLDVLSDVLITLTPAGPTPHAGGQTPHISARPPARHHRRRKAGG